MAAYLAGEDDVWAAACERAHHECLRQGDARRAARCAFWLGFGLLQRGEMAPAGGWLARARAPARRAATTTAWSEACCCFPVALGHLFAGDTGNALAEFTDALAIGVRFGDAGPDGVRSSRPGTGARARRGAGAAVSPSSTR